MKFLLEIQMDNAAFATESDRTWELRHMLMAARNQIKREPVEVGASGTLLDINGNTVGNWKVVAW